MNETNTTQPIDQSIELIDVANLDDESRKSLHRSLYRQECRAWLLWCILGLLIPSFLRPIMGDVPAWAATVILILGIAYAWFISFWVISPSQLLLLKLRDTAGPEKSREIEGGFDDSWSSVKDFIPPLLIPPLIIFVFLIFRLIAVY